MDWRLFASAFALIFVAELPGKTTFASILMSARARPGPVFLGACGAFVLHSAIAVTAGSLLGRLPVRPVEIAVGSVFLVLAVLMWTHGEDGVKTQPLQSQDRFNAAVAAAFGVIFVAQWGDPTQLATAALAAKYPTAPWTIFVSSTLALWLVTALAVTAGHFSGKAFQPRFLQRLAALVFAAVGLFLLAH